MSKQQLLETIKDVESEVVDASQADKSFTEANQPGAKTMADAAKQDPARKRQFAEAAAMLGGVLSGKLPSYKMKEAMSTSDFPILFGDVMDRLLLAGYRAAPQTFDAYTRTTTVRDFREVQRNYVDGADGLLDEVGELSEYKADSLDEGRYTYRVKKYGKVVPFSFEAMINDDLDAFADMPQRLGRGAARSEEDFVTRLFVGSDGLNSDLFTESNDNIVTSPLNMEGLLEAYNKMNNQRDPHSDMPILNTPAFLVVPPNLEIAARQLVNATEIRQTQGDNTMIASNYLNGLQIIVNRHIPIVAGDNQPWFLFADPSEGRGALELGRLRGHEEPEVFVKSPNAQMAGGGDVGYMQGDFDTDSITYKIRHVFGGTAMDHMFVVGSDGSGD